MFLSIVSKMVKGKLLGAISVCYIDLPVNGLQFALTVVMPIVAVAHISLRIFIFNRSDENYSGVLIEYLAMKMMRRLETSPGS